MKNNTSNISSASTIKKTKSILVSRQTGGIGDILMLTPTIRAIKKAHPGTPLIVCTTSGYLNGVLFEILKHNPWIDKVISVNELFDYKFKKVYNFGTGKEMEIESKTGKNRIDIFAELAGVNLVDKQTVYAITNEEKKWVRTWLKEKIPNERKCIIGIQVHTTTNKRDWGAEKSLLLAFQIVNTWKDTSVLLFYEGNGSERPPDYPNIHCVVGFPIRTVAALINECSCFVAPDSGLLHLAGALNVNLVGVFGSIEPDSRINYYQNAKSVCLYYPCAPCLTGDTKISLLSGEEVQIKNLTERGEFGVYSCKEDGKIVPGNAKAFLSKKNAEVVKVTLDNGESFKCTPDHLCMLRNGLYERADSSLGEPLMPLYRKYGIDGYERFYSNRNHKWYPTHLMVDMYFGGSLKPMEVVHHSKIGNIKNNDPRKRERQGLNHKIVSMEFAGYEDVYDISVKEHFNFALSSGIFVHNCWYNACTGHHECMERIPVQSVIQKVGEHLGRLLISKRKKNDILVIRRGGIGDLILLSNALRELKQQQSKLDIHLAVLSKWVPLFKGLSFLKDVFSLEEISKKGVFGTVYDLRMAVEPPRIGGKLDWKLYVKKSRSDNFEDLIGVKVKDKKFDIVVGNEAVSRMKEKLVGFNPPIVSILAGADCYFRNIPYELVLGLIDMAIYRLGASVVLLGTSRDWCKYLSNIERHRVLNLINKTNPEELVAMLSLSNLVIAPDTGAAHVGGALGKPTLVMVGNVPFNLRYAHYPTVRGVEAKVKPECVPCYDALATEEDILVAKKHLCVHGGIVGATCMRNIRLEDVLEEVVHLAREWKK
jgi:ADP-heptose:LPS heptosyltransferase